MLPARDDLEHQRAPVATGALTATAVLGALALLVGGDGAAAALLALVSAIAIWVFGAGVEGAVGRLWLAAVALMGAAGGAALTVAFGGEGRWIAGAAAGAALEVVATHLLRFPSARIMGLSLIPPFAGLVEAPAWIWALGWALITALLIALGALA